MHDINKRHIALVKAKIAELEKWENRDRHTHRVELTRGGTEHNTRERENTEQATPAITDTKAEKKRKGQREEEETQNNTHEHTDNTQKRQKRVTMEHKTEDRTARTRLNENRRSQLQQQPPGDDDPGGAARKWGD